jgi:hypothetical protein
MQINYASDKVYRVKEICKYNIYTIILIIVISSTGIRADSTKVIEEEPAIFIYGLENDFITQYIWRGISYNEGHISQPSLWIEYSGLTFYTWASMTFDDKNGNSENNEVDFAVQYSTKYESLLIEPLVAYYIYPNQIDAPPTAEINLKLAYPVFEFELYTNVCLDILEYQGSLSGDFGFKKSIFENDYMNIALDLNTGWANRKFCETYIDITDDIEIFHFLSCSLGMDYYLSENIYIKPHIEYYYIFSPLLKSVSGNSLTNFGLAVGVEF